MVTTLTTLIEAGKTLCGAKPPEPSLDVKGVLAFRLNEYHAATGASPRAYGAVDLGDLELETGLCALDLLEKLSQALETEPSTPQSTNSPPHAIGTRDLAHIRTMLAIVFKWAVMPHLSKVVVSWPATVHKQPPARSQIIDLTSTPDAYHALTSVVSRLITLLYPKGVEGELSNGLISTDVLDRHLSDLLRPCIVMGWLPKSLATHEMPVADAFRPPIMKLLATLPAFQTIAALGAVLRPPPVLPPHAQKACSSLLSRQLLRPDGVRGLCTTVLSSEDLSGETASLEKLEHISRLLRAVPAGMAPEAYFQFLVDRVFEILKSTKPVNHVRAAAFTLSQMLSLEDFRHKKLVSSVTSTKLHRPFVYAETPTDGIETSQALTAVDGLTLLIALFTNTDPSPTLISTLLTPILPHLYSLSFHFKQKKTTNPAIRSSLEGILMTWGRIADTTECVASLWLIVEGEGGNWDSDITGNFYRVNEDRQRTSALSLFTPADLKQAEEAGDLDTDANILDLRPDPATFVQYVNTIERPEVSSELFVRLLESHQRLKDDVSDPLKTLLYLQLIVQMQHRLTGNSSSSILNEPDHILSFVKHALEDAVRDKQGSMSDQKDKGRNDLTLENLRIVEQNEKGPDGDSDDEADEDWAGDEMTSTAINLLLSILEKHSSLPPRATSTLNDIFDLLEAPSLSKSDSLRRVAREARMVIIARLASEPTLKNTTQQPKEKDFTQETYQKALKLLQDPILPVRAHGLLLLRQLVSPSRSKNAKGPAVDKALAPAILHIFLQSLHDEDSYIFLNAVQGLSAMVDGFGKEVLTGLVGEYSGGLDGLSGTQMTQTQLDVRLRIGEALGQVIRRSGSALGIHADLLIPMLMRVFRTSHFPTPLRISALSLLAESARTYILVIFPYSNGLADAMVDLLQIEGVPSAGEEEGDKRLNDKPTGNDTKVASLRRSALHFISLMLRGAIEHAYDASMSLAIISPSVAQRLGVTLRYVAATDSDQVAKVQAREAIELLDQMKEAQLGL